MFEKFQRMIYVMMNKIDELTNQISDNKNEMK